MLTAADIKSLHAEILAVREVLSSKLGTQLETGSSDEVRNAITQYVKKGNSAKTQAEGQAKARDIIKDAIPYAKKAVNEETGAEVAGIRQEAESTAEAQHVAEDTAILQCPSGRHDGRGAAGEGEQSPHIRGDTAAFYQSCSSLSPPSDCPYRLHRAKAAVHPDHRFSMMRFNYAAWFSM